ncbi:phage minor capsid protein [Sanguibacter sp. 25GB23B1]|uniref:phage minor capsid protein n=1 Tax=unclassified Sanguibacter TaxID=2645534 RepID=UPI0032AFF6EF
MTQPDSIENLTAQLRADVTAVWAWIMREQEALLLEWWGLVPSVRAYRLKELEASVRSLGDQVDTLAATSVLTATQAAYEVGAFTTAVAVNTVASFTAIDAGAITALAQDTMDDILLATRGMDESAKAFTRTMTRDWVRAKIYTGLTAEQAGVRLAAELIPNGITSITYANGRKVGLSTYTDMVLRTKTAIAHQEGAFNQAEALGVGWMEIFDGADCGWTDHADLQKANGMIVTLKRAREYPISHPNCHRSSSPRIDIESEADAKRARATTTEAQRADQQAAEEARAAAYARQPRSVNLDRQVATRRRTNIDLADGVVGSKAAARNAVIVRNRVTPPE